MVAKKLGYEQPGAGRWHTRLGSGQFADLAKLDGPQLKYFLQTFLPTLQKGPGMQAVKMFTTAVCPYCTRAKQLLKARGVEQIEEIRIDQDPSARTHMMESTGPAHRAANFIGSTHVGGYDDLAALDAQGGLVPLLNS